MTEPIEVKIAQIRVDGGTQPRAQLNYATVTEYAEAIEDGASFPPIELARLLRLVPETVIAEYVRLDDLARFNPNQG